MDRIRQIIFSTLLSILLYAIGIVGYMGIEKWNFIDSVYMTAITLSTVGFGEIHPVSSNGRIFTVFLIFSGVGLVLYLAGVVMQFVVEGEIRAMLGRRKLDKSINKLKDHYIVCGLWTHWKNPV